MSNDKYKLPELPIGSDPRHFDCGEEVYTSSDMREYAREVIRITLEDTHIEDGTVGAFDKVVDSLAIAVVESGCLSTQAAANKAAEEGELPALKFDVETSDELTDTQNQHLNNLRTLNELLICFSSWEPQVCVVGNVRAGDSVNAIRQAIAADRAARPVANKAEVEPVLIAKFAGGSIRDFADFREDVERLSTADSRTAKHIRKAIYDTIDARVRNSVVAALMGVATPPATTGASTATASIDTPEFQEMMAEWFNHDDAETAYSGIHWERIVNHINKHNAVGASTVLTDERIDVLWREAVNFNEQGSKAEMSRRFARAVAREVAAQAGQVAVQEGDL